MNEAPLHWLWIGIAALIVASAYFSSSETAMMSLNRYRLRHRARNGDVAARRAERLLQRPDRLLGVILTGNNVVNFYAASLATVLAYRLYGDSGVAIAPLILTFVFLIFAEVAPKTLAAQAPERLALPSSLLLVPLLRVLHPVVWLINGLSNTIVRPFTGDSGPAQVDRLTPEEFRTLVRDGFRLPKGRRDMLLNLLDLEKVTVDDIMVPRSEVNGIDLNDDIDAVVRQICSSNHTRLPVYRGSINNVLGVLHVRNANRFLTGEFQTHEALLEEVRDPYFVMEGTPLHTQLINFQREQRRVGLVVDEYGDVQGIVTLEDILEEIVGEFTTDFAANIAEIHPQEDGTVVIDGRALLRDINRALGYDLPTAGPKTFNGLILEHLEFIPESPVCTRIGDYCIEILQIRNNVIRSARVTRHADSGPVQASSLEDEADEIGELDAIDESPAPDDSSDRHDAGVSDRRTNDG